ncbi:MAG: glycosyltransferase family 4 protein [Acidimicrobiales bacterium]
MKIAVAASDVPHPQGTSAGRDLWAWCTGMIELGHELDAWVWTRSSLSPVTLPDWAHDVCLELGPMWRVHVRSLVRPRGASARIMWDPDPDAVLVADHVSSAAAVAGHARSVVTLHFRALADARAVRRVSATEIQMARAERRAARRAAVVLAYSDRVGRHLAKAAHWVPISCMVPDEPMQPVAEPVVGLVADWSWLPNAMALRHLLSMWPEIHSAVPGSRLVLAGRRMPVSSVGAVAGVEVIGEVADSRDVLGRCALVVFPCPNSSGPKGKTIEALAHGIPVVTTEAGAEGLALPPDAAPMVTGIGDMAARVVDLLRAPERRAALGAVGREAMAAHHSPRAAAQARLDVFHSSFGI